ncbi:hypothetical protein [Vibrio alginolyticus]|uniref:hypothetical protein n=1 Tax=Vibrio TaxID=662 RepID=UPI0006CA7EBC|nr:hypothetical protein [Vibrio alginolyticus]KPM98408.1 hypothetical protein AOG25_08150 [Vibrio alginolyticus]
MTHAIFKIDGRFHIEKGWRDSKEEYFLNQFGTKPIEIRPDSRQVALKENEVYTFQRRGNCTGAFRYGLKRTGAFWPFDYFEFNRDKNRTSVVVDVFTGVCGKFAPVTLHLRNSLSNKLWNAIESHDVKIKRVNGFIYLALMSDGIETGEAIKLLP